MKKLVPAAVLPVRANDGDIGYDCIAIDDGIWSDDGRYIEYRTGLAIEPPHGYHVELFSRSSISKCDLVLANSVGLVDNSYRGEICFRFKFVPPIVIETFLLTVAHYDTTKPYEPKLYNKGDKIGQIVFRQSLLMDICEVDELSETIRGVGGFGSSDLGK